MAGQFLTGGAGVSTRLQDFYEKLRQGGVKLQHQYQLRIDLPNNFSPMSDGNAEISQREINSIAMWAQSATLPSRTQNSAEIQYLAYTFNVPSNMEMSNELTVTINVQKKLNIRHALLGWMSSISHADILAGGNGEGPKSLSNSNVTGTGRIYLLDDEFEKADYIYELIGLYPSNVGEAEMSNVGADIVTFEATFRYQFWRVLNGDAVGIEGGLSSADRERDVFSAIPAS